jgi:hypothetical protein
MSILYDGLSDEIDGAGQWVPGGAVAAGITGKPSAAAIGGAQASGSILFAANPLANATVTIGGTAVTFVASGAVGNQVNIGASLAATLAALVTMLSASADANLVKATYAVDGTNTKLLVTAKANGSVGNAITLAASLATPSGPTLSTGVDRAISLKNEINYVKSDGNDGHYTLANGVDGQEKVICMNSAGAGKAVIVPASFDGTHTTITFTAVNQFVSLMFLNGGWRVLGNGGATLA